MGLKSELHTYLEDGGRLVLPPGLASRFGLKTGTPDLIGDRDNGLSGMSVVGGYRLAL
jgi:bifunctional DNA-binding transcriptional regulator/antitoxin component of YhaV-PrlF toxin-antitoxin module